MCEEKRRKSASLRGCKLFMRATARMTTISHYETARRGGVLKKPMSLNSVRRSQNINVGIKEYIFQLQNQLRYKIESVKNQLLNNL